MKAAGIQLQEEGDRHKYLRLVSRKDRFTFAFVRDPLSWYGSWWQHCRLLDPARRAQAFFVRWPADQFVNLPFDQYVEASAVRWPGFITRLFRRYVGSPEMPIEFAGQYERLADDLVLALRMAEQNFDEEALRAFPPVNVSAAMPRLTQERSAQLTNRLIEAEPEVYERFYGLALDPATRADRSKTTQVPSMPKILW
jgi:hypothetical protein